MVVNRSVINCMIAAGVLATGVGVAPAPALADPDKSGASRGSDNPRPVRPKVRPGRPGAEKSDAGQGGDSLCEWSRVCRPGPPQRSRGNSGLGMIALAVVPVLARPPVSAIEPEVMPILDLAAVETLRPPAAEGTPVAAPDLPQAAPQMPAAQAVAPRLAPIATASLPAAPALKPLSRVASVPPAAPPRVPAQSVELPRLGYPDELRNADFGRVAALALPGLAAIAGMTALGGMFGYRQAKAGYVLRAAGAGRFLQ